MPDGKVLAAEPCRGDPLDELGRGEDATLIDGFAAGARCRLAAEADDSVNKSALFRRP